MNHKDREAFIKYEENKKTDKRLLRMKDNSKSLRKFFNKKKVA